MCVVFLRVWFFHVVFFLNIKSISLSATASFSVYYTLLWSDLKEESFSMSWTTRNYLLPCDLPVFITKLYGSNQVDLSSTFIASVAYFCIHKLLMMLLLIKTSLLRL